METNNGIKIAHTKNLPTLNIKSQLNISIDSNTHIKQVLNIETCLIDVQIEPMLNKALIRGVLGVKVVYVDMDNMFNSLSNTVNFSETLVSDNIIADSQIIVGNSQFITEFETENQMLHINIEGNLDCFCNLNLAMNIFNPINEYLITKKSVLQACSCVQKINKTTSFDYDFKLDAKINKILSYDSKVIIADTKCYDGYVLLTGEIINTIIYEIESDGNNVIKINTNSTPFKSEVEATLCDEQCVADLKSHINLNDTQITTDINENSTQFNFEYCVVVNGYIYKNVNVDIVEDLYSLDSEVDEIKSKFVLCQKMPYIKLNENVDSEITLSDEINIDEILGMVSTHCNITQTSIKENSIIVEGVINGNLLYMDENHEIKNLATQLPYSLTIKNDYQGEICGMNLSVVPTNCKCKIKRGNTLMVDYELCLMGTIYTQTNLELIDNVKYGKTLDYGDIAFQIFVAHEGENCWQLCKRLHITQEQLALYNKETPEVYSGGEKVIVYR